MRIKTITMKRINFVDPYALRATAHWNEWSPFLIGILRRRNTLTSGRGLDKLVVAAKKRRDALWAAENAPTED
jgi:hypothetical protein